MAPFTHFDADGTPRDFADINGAIVYQGPSEIDRRPIVVVAIFDSSNAKTRAMVQTYIIRSDIDPVTASKTGQDYSICGTCPLRGVSDGESSKGRGCYVVLLQGPGSVYKGFRRGIYPRFDDLPTDARVRKIQGRPIRMGTYGDPAAVPRDVWDSFLANTDGGRTGYTHQWRDAKFAWLKHYAMASVDSLADYQAAKDAGWRTFRVRRDIDDVQPTEIICPASEEGGKRLNCDRCMACNGGAPSKRDVVIIGHGGIAATANVHRTLARLAVIQ